MTPRELLEQLNELDEHTRVEAKAASEIGKSALETIYYYLPTEKLLAPWQAQSPGRDPQSGKQSVQPAEALEQAPQIVGKAVGLTGQSIQAEAQSIHPTDLPAPLAIQIQAVGRRATPDVIRSAILALCAWRPLSADDLATLLHRTRIHLVNKHLRPMLQEGQLQRTIPDQPNHPQQRYHAAVPPEERR